MYELIETYGVRATVLVLGLLTSLVMVRLFALIKLKWIRERVEALWSEVRAAVRRTAQTYVDAIKEGRADGKLTEEEKAEALSRAVAEIKSNFGMKGLRALSRALGIDSSIEDWLGAKVEAVIGEDKATARKLEAAAKPAAPPLPS